MDSLVQQFLLTFVPIFIAIDALGNLPIILSLSSDMTNSQRIRMVNVAILTASVVGLAFLFIGKIILDFLGIRVADFAIAGGLVLVALSVRDLTTGKMMEMPLKEELVAVVPIGTPLTVGPATLTTLLLLGGEYSMGIVLIAFVLNLLAAWAIFLMGNTLGGFLGQGGMRAVSKVASLLLAAIAIRMIIKGITMVFPGIGGAA